MLRTALMQHWVLLYRCGGAPPVWVYKRCAPASRDEPGRRNSDAGQIPMLPGSNVQFRTMQTVRKCIEQSRKRSGRRFGRAQRRRRQPAWCETIAVNPGIHSTVMLMECECHELPMTRASGALVGANHSTTNAASQIMVIARRF
jgi:hypothetical protein